LQEELDNPSITNDLSEVFVVKIITELKIPFKHMEEEKTKYSEEIEK
jgi:hypothetical protein